MSKPPDEQLANVENQCHLLLYISGVNLICNIVTIIVAVVIAA